MESHKKHLQIDSSAIKKDNGNWTKSDAEKAETFANHLSDVFKPFPRNMTQEKERKLLENQESINISTCSNQGLRSIKKSECLDQSKILN